MDSKIHDYGYTYLFEDPEMVRQLLETCVDEGWVSELVIDTNGFAPTSAP